MNETYSQVNCFEAARGPTTRFKATYLPKAANAPRCANCEEEVPGVRFIAMMEKTTDGHYIFLDAT
eukprot:11376037-Prorocentrum_lima.AAC.1